MTQDEIIEMAREAGFNFTGTRDIWCDSTFVLEAFAKLVAAKERVECIGIAWDNGAVEVADAIRARGET